MIRDTREQNLYCNWVISLVKFRSPFGRQVIMSSLRSVLYIGRQGSPPPTHTSIYTDARFFLIFSQLRMSRNKFCLLLIGEEGEHKKTPSQKLREIKSLPIYSINPGGLTPVYMQISILSSSKIFFCVDKMQHQFYNKVHEGGYLERQYM